MQWMEEFLTNPETVKILKMSKVPESRLSIDFTDIGVLDAGYIKDAYKWLSNLHEGAYAEALACWNLVTPAMWNHYDLMGIVDLKEQILRDDAFKALRAAVIASKEKPDFFKRGKRNAAVRKAIKAKKVDTKGKNKKARGAGGSAEAADAKHTGSVQQPEQSD